MSELSPREVELVTKARKDEREEIISLINKFVRTTTLSDGDTVSEIKVPANHLTSLISARGSSMDHKISGVEADPDAWVE